MFMLIGLKHTGIHGEQNTSDCGYHWMLLEKRTSRWKTFWNV